MKSRGTMIRLYKDSDLDAALAGFDGKVEEEKVQIETQISEMEINYKLWGITRSTPPRERASKIPADQVSKVLEFEKNRPAFERRLKARGQFDWKMLFAVPSVTVPSNANDEFSLTLPDKGHFALLAMVNWDGEWRPDTHPLFRWIRSDDIRRGKITLTERDSFWRDDARDWIVFWR